MGSSAHVGNKGKDTLILGEGPTQRLVDTTLTAEAKYPISFTQLRKRFVLSLHHNGGLIYILMNTVKNFTSIHLRLN